MFQLSDYYTDADPLYRGIIKEVYTPFSICDNWRLVGTDEKIKAKYEEYYERIGLRDKMESIFLQFYKYANVYVYLMEDGQIITLPVNLIRVTNLTVNNEPVLEMNVRSIRDDIKKRVGKAYKKWIEDEDLTERLKGYPPEVAEALKQNLEYVQLDPNRTFAMQDLKEDWVRYAVPMVTTCLRSFAKKEVISNYENALLNLGMRSFVHVKYGDPTNTVIPDRNALSQVQMIFKQAMTGTALAVTNNWCDAKIIQPDTEDMFQDDKYKSVNADILSAGGISGVIVSGRSEDGSTFASAQVSMQTAAMRITQAKKNFCEMMNKINMRLNGRGGAIPHSDDSRVPLFTFPPVDLSGNRALQEACSKLWEKGCVSDETLMQTYGYDYKQEVDRKKAEKASGNDMVLMPKEKPSDASCDNNTNNQTDTEVTVRGRPTLDDTERHSDPSHSVTGRQPKASNPDGSQEQ